MLKLGGDVNWVCILLPRNKTLVILVRNYDEAVIRVFCSSLILLDLFVYFVQETSLLKNLCICYKNLEK